MYEHVHVWKCVLQNFCVLPVLVYLIPLLRAKTLPQVLSILERILVELLKIPGIQTQLSRSLGPFGFMVASELHFLELKHGG